MTPTKTRVIAIDPGLATGYCVFDWEPGQEPVLTHAGEVGYDGFALEIRHWIDNSFPNRPVIVCERFTITLDTAKKAQAPYSLELIGQLKLIMADRHYIPSTDLVLQKPADAKTVFPNPKLKKLDYWHVGGEGHALDAIRHGLLYLAKNGWTPARLLD